MALPHNIALAATGLDPENGLGVVKAWVESGGDVNGCWDAEETLRLVTAIRAAGSWKRYVRTPHIKLVVLRSLIACGRARRRPLWDHPTPHALVRLFDPSLPNGVFWHVLSYWRETG